MKDGRRILPIAQGLTRGEEGEGGGLWEKPSPNCEPLQRCGILRFGVAKVAVEGAY